jgi:hypothetical protein
MPAAAEETAPYSHRCADMFLALSAHYMFSHSVNERLSGDIDASERAELARKAYTLGCDVVQAVVDVCGTELRQTYLHDIVYGLQKLFIVLGKPYLAATEGNEHAHCEMKKDFHMMCSHSNKSYCNMHQLMDHHFLRRSVNAKHGDFAKPTRQSESYLGMDLGVSEGKRKRKRHDDSIPTADAHLTAMKGEKTEGSPSKKAKTTHAEEV